METELNKLREILDSSKNMVFFGGAGLSTESGIPDFRSAQGLFRKGQEVSPEKMVSHTGFVKYPQEFYDFYRSKIVHKDAMPNPAHYALAELERRGILQMVVTQNVDGLHQKAGSKRVIELHGSIYRNYCMRCEKEFPLETILETEEIPHCDECGTMIRPDVVLFGESLRKANVIYAMRHIAAADTLLIGGTSLVVSPASNLIDHFKGKNLVIINKDEAAFGGREALCIQAPIGQVLGEVVLGNS
ncbi:MAG: NAD-dependent protein deacylase [Raoultibacter sp.]